jgi:hypothetical protein
MKDKRYDRMVELDIEEIDLTVNDARHLTT